MLLPDHGERIRALIVESDVLWADAHAKVLMKHDCSVTIVPDADEALRLMQACYYHLVILETQENILPRIIDENKWFKYTVVCVCSEKVLVYESLAYWLRDKQATGISLDNVLYFSKGDYFPEKFWERIEQELQNKKLVGQLSLEKEEAIETLSYQMTNNLIDHIQSTRDSSKLYEHDTWVRDFYETEGYEPLRIRVEYEIYDLLRRCINVGKIKTIQLISINGGLSKAAVIGVTPMIGEKWGKSSILKIGYHKEIQDERDAYDNHVKYIMERAPKAEIGPRTPLLSSILYDFVEEGHSFGEIYRRPYVSNAEIETLLDDLFKKSYSEWFRNPVDSTVTAREYMDYLKCDANRLYDAIRHIEQQPELQNYNLWGVDYIRLPDVRRVLPNPVPYLHDSDFLGRLDYLTRNTITHGDLNANNILIRNNTEAWLIDFARTEHSHALRDFIQLETVVRFALLDEATLEERYEMESYLADQTAFNEIGLIRRVYNPTGPNAHALERAYQITCKIRELAWDVALNHAPSSHRIANFKQYQMGLFFMSLTTIRFVKHKRSPKGLSTTQALHALMAAALLLRNLR